MIKVKKDFNNIPDILNSNNRKEAFDKNINNKAFNHGKNLYKPNKLKNRLHKIYHLKCAYCEDSLFNAPKHIEHYRPKDIYYWLAYSWDNLLLCCTSCNSSKKLNFKTINEKINYTDETFDEIHNLRDKYDELEKPLLVNPEKDDILKDIVFDKYAKISSNNDRVKYTIETCNLNRNELQKSRIEILNDFNILINAYHFLFNKNNSQDKSISVKSFIPLVKKFVDDCKKENEFYSFRYFILNNIDVFFEDKKIQKILQALIKKINGNNL